MEEETSAPTAPRDDRIMLVPQIRTPAGQELLDERDCSHVSIARR